MITSYNCFSIETFRGDTHDVKFTINNPDKIFPKDFEINEIYFSVKKENAGRLLFQKKLSDGTIFKIDDTYFLRIESSDTADLAIGDYVCDFEISGTNGVVKTFSGKIHIYPDVTTERDKA